MENFIDVSEWVPVHQLPGFEACIEYYVNKAGEVKSTKYKEDRILKHRPHKAGYPMVCLTQRIGKGWVVFVFGTSNVQDEAPGPFKKKVF